MVDATDTLHMVTADAAIDWDSLLAGWRAVIAAAGAATGQPRPRVAAFSETGALLVAAGQVGPRCGGGDCRGTDRRE